MLSYSRFHTETRTCPYLGDRPSQLEVHIMASVRPQEHSALLAAGVRHFGRSYFRPACQGCSQCVSIRVPVADFQLSRSQHRVLAKNREVQVEVGEPTVDDARLDLYRRFHAEREATRGWEKSEMCLEEYTSSFLDNPVRTLELRYLLGGRLVAVAYVDDSPTELNSIFAYWEPQCAKLSLGIFDVLTEIRLACSLGKKHLYLGYHVRGCQSLEYKSSFRPFELLVDGVWVRQPAVVAGGPASET